MSTCPLMTLSSDSHTHYVCRFRFFVSRFSPKLIAIELAGKRRIIQGWPAKADKIKVQGSRRRVKAHRRSALFARAANMKRFCLANALFDPLDGKIFSPIKEKHKSGSVDARCHRMFPSHLLFIVFAPRAAFVQTGETSIRSLWIFDKLIRTWGELWAFFITLFQESIFSTRANRRDSSSKSLILRELFRSHILLVSSLHWFSTSFHRSISISKIICFTWKCFRSFSNFDLKTTQTGSSACIYDVTRLSTPVCYHFFDSTKRLLRVFVYVLLFRRPWQRGKGWISAAGLFYSNPEFRSSPSKNYK